MSRTLAIIEDGIVANVILADAWPGGIDVTDLVPRPGPGWTFDGETFAPPVVVAPPPPVVVTHTPRMSHFGFLSRLTPQTRLAIRDRTDKASAQYDPILDDAMFLFNSAEQIDVSLPLTQQLVGYMMQTGLIAPADMATALAEIESTSPHAKP